MGEKREISAKKYASELFWGYVIWGFLFTIIIGGLLIGYFTDAYQKVTDWDTLDRFIDESVVVYIITAVVTFVSSGLAWVIAVRRTVKKNTTARENIPEVVKRLRTTLIVILLIMLAIGAMNVYMELSEKLNNCKIYFSDSVCTDLVNSAKPGAYFGELFSRGIVNLVYVFAVPLFTKKYLEKNI